MEWLHDPYSPAAAAAKLAMSLLLGAIIGVDREYKHKPAGIRTLVLISVGSALFMIVSIYAFSFASDARDSISWDGSRIAAQVVSGVGFIGAGVIMRHGLNVKGLNTAASIWVVAAIGLATGAGMFLIAIMFTIAVLFALIALDWVEKRFFTGDHQKILFLSSKDTRFDLKDITAALHAHGVEVSDVEMMRSLRKSETQMKILIRIPRSVSVESLLVDLGKMKNLVKIGFENREN